MKKFLGILVLGLFLSVSAYAESTHFKCKPMKVFGQRIPNFDPELSIYLDDKIIGRKTSGNYSFNFKKNLAFGYITTDLTNDELVKKNIFIEVEKIKHKAEILLKPLKQSNFKIN